jgi:hypothetical protein
LTIANEILGLIRNGVEIANADVRYPQLSEFRTVSGDVTVLSGDVTSIYSTLDDVDADIRYLSGQISRDYTQDKSLSAYIRALDYTQDKSLSSYIVSRDYSQDKSLSAYIRVQDYSQDKSLSAYILNQVPRVTLSVITGLQVSGNTLQYKSQSIVVLSAGIETNWTIFHTGTTCP